ncbi:MAG TPA: hypothetical protein VFQ61_34960 [Polyangiaceae bacterium]|nr:hypothetical protein [Polyangiaceae bacterium]
MKTAWFVLGVLCPVGCLTEARADSLRVVANLECRASFESKGSGLRWAGMLAVELPLDRIAAPRPSSVAPLLVAAKVSAGKVTDEPRPEDTERADPPSPRERQTSRPLDWGMALRLAAAALRKRGDVSIAQRLEAMAARARSSAALPELMLRALRSTDESLRLSPSASSAWDFTHTGGAGWVFEARATWKLDRLVFADEELAIERLRAEREAARERLVGSVLKYFSRWLVARARLANPSLEPERLLVLEAELAFCASALDTLTGGAFKAELERRSARGGAAASEGP